MYSWQYRRAGGVIYSMEIRVMNSDRHPRLRRSGMTAFICFLTLQSQAARVPMAQAPMAQTPMASAPVISISTMNAVMVSSTFSWRSEPNTAFGLGEDFHYVVKWGVIVAGYSSLSVPEIITINQRPTYHIVSAARSGGMVNAFYTVEDHNDVWMDESALVTVRYEKRIHEGKYQIEETSILDQPGHRWKTRSYRLDNNTYEEKEGDLPPNALDSFGSLYYVRTLPLELGQTYTIDVHSGDKVYPLIVNVLKREKIKVPAGKFDCILVEPFLRGPGIFISKGKKLQVWLTADERRIPVRMRSEIMIGHVSAELTQYQLGSQTPSP
jgi:hypothetical protein